MNVLFVILLMMLVTYIPRMLPSIITDKLRFDRKFKKYLELIPYTAMAALIFPGVVWVNANVWAVGVIGALVAILLALIKKIPVVLVVIGAVLADMAVYYFI